MGYRSKFSLDAPAEHHAAIHAALTELAYPAGGGYAAKSPFVIDAQWVCDECKWYSRDKDCKAVAELFPGVSFAVFSLGEDEDEWSRHMKRSTR